MSVVDDDREIVIKSKYPDIKLPTGTLTITDMLWPQLEKYSKETALICGITEEKYTYDQVKEYSQNFSSSLRKLNVKEGSIVGIVTPTCPKAIIAFLGVWRADCTIAPLNPLYTLCELQRKFEILSIDTIITTNELLPTVNACRSFKNVIVIECQVDRAEKKIFSFEEMMTTPADHDFEPRNIDNKENIVLISDSTGTSGEPKSVVISHFSMCTNIRQIFSPDFLSTKALGDGSTRNVSITVFPLSHLMGSLVCLIWPMLQGFTLICLPKFEPKSYHACFRKYKPTFCALVTPLIKFLIDSPLFEENDFEHLTTIFAGAAPLPKQYIDDLIKKANRNILFQECYGATEILLYAICNPSLNNSKCGSVGRLFPNSEAKIVDLTTGKSLGPNKIGEIRAKSPCEMKGYFKDKVATKSAFDDDEYYCTGDVGYYDEDECFYIVDRVRDMIKVKAMQVSPKEIETEILQHPKVDNVCVIGVPHDRLGEAPRAYIVAKDGSLKAEEVHSFLENKLAPFKQLAGGIEFIDSIPQVGVGKPLRRKLKNRYLALFPTVSVKSSVEV